MTDEIITEVWAIKDAIAEKCHYDIRALYQQIKQGETELEAKGFRLILPPASVLQRNRFKRR